MRKHFIYQSADWVARAQEVEQAKIVREKVPLPKREARAFVIIYSKV